MNTTVSFPPSRPTLVTDTATVFVRELRPVLRSPFSIIFSMIQPLFFLALFARYCRM